MEVIYKIIGGDGREYGPATLEELKTWATDGRVGTHTQVWRSDAERWAPALLYQELQPQLIAALPAPVAETAGFWPRCAAYFLDLAILMALFSVLWPLVAAHYGWKSEISVDDIFPVSTLPKDESATILFLSLFVRAIYEIPLNTRFGATFGKMAMGLRIVHPDGSRIGFRVAFARWCGCRVSDFILAAGYLLVLFRKDKRALHDLLAGTKVVYIR
jgi:uncharacterized RDD family membrane protein YckC